VADRTPRQAVVVDGGPAARSAQRVGLVPIDHCLGGRPTPRGDLADRSVAEPSIDEVIARVYAGTPA
jgi:hypothetical protein